MTHPKSDWLLSAPVSATNKKAETPLFPYLARLMRGEDLSVSDAAKFFQALTDVNANPAQIAAALTALTAKGETFEELAGMAGVMRSQAVSIKAPGKFAVDITGTGSSPSKTFNVSTAAALVAAGAGLMIAKQSNRGVTSSCGSADLLGELGVEVAGEPAIAQTSLSGAGLCFLFAPKFHPHLRRVGDIRSSLGIRTCLNVLGVLANPAGVSRQLVGVWHRSLVEPVAKALALLKTDLAWVVHGEDGLDEITLTGKTFVGAVSGTEVRPYTISPADFGIKPGSIEHLREKSAKESAKIIRDVLASQRRDEARSLIVLNAAAALVVGGLATDPMHAARLAEQSIDSGMAQNKLERLVQVTNKKVNS
ncbi:MAG: anthranilate phosphoribosyltransferase [Pyrinomonadaceae bacterium]